MRLTERDKQIVAAVYHCRALTTAQIERLFFSCPFLEDQELRDTSDVQDIEEESEEDQVEEPVEPRGAKETTKAPRAMKGTQQAKFNSRCQHRLQLLFHHGFLFRDEQPQKISDGRKPLVYFLDEAGAQLLANEFGLEIEELGWSRTDRDVRDVGYPFLQHLLSTNDVRVALTVATRLRGIKMPTWYDERYLKSRQMTDTVTITGPKGAKQRAAVVPDSYFVLDDGEHVYHHFLEADLRTVTGSSSVWGKRDWARKVSAYIEYFRSGLYQARYRTQSIRVLTVTTSQKRLENMKAITEAAGGRARFWFTTFDQVDGGTILTKPIWQKAGSEGFYSLVW